MGNLKSGRHLGITLEEMGEPFLGGEKQIPAISGLVSSDHRGHVTQRLGTACDEHRCKYTLMLPGRIWVAVPPK